MSGTSEAEEQAAAPVSEKDFATLQAAFALQGFELRRTSTSTFLVLRWNLSRHFNEIEDVRRFAVQVGASRAR